MLLLAPSHADMSTDKDGADDIAGRKLRYDAAFLSNGGAGNRMVSLPLSGNSRVCGGISNGVSSGMDPFTGLKTGSEWPKVVQGREMLSDVLSNCESENTLVEGLFNLLR
jgi:hypothetical protein